MRTPRRPTALALALTLAATLAACSDPGRPSPPPSPAPSSPSQTTAPTSTEPSTTPPDAAPTSTPPPDAAPTTTEPEAERPQMPDVARERSLEGATAYAETYLEAVGYHVMNPEVDALSGFAVSADCSLCQAWIEQNDIRLEEGIRGDQVALQLGRTEGSLDEQGAILSITAVQPEITMRDSAGRVDSVIEAASGRFAFVLDWVDNSWVIANLQFGPDE